MTDTTHEPIWVRCGDTTPIDRRNLLWVTVTILAWAVCFTGVSQVIKRELLPSGPLLWLLATLPAVAGLVVILVYARFLRDLDELQRLLHLQALALAFAGTFFAYCGYRVFERLGAPQVDISAYAVVWSLLLVAKSMHAWRRYR